MKFVPKSPINNIQALIQIMAWRRPGDKSLSEPMMVSLTHICVTRPQWIKTTMEVVCYFAFNTSDKINEFSSDHRQAWIKGWMLYLTQAWVYSNENLLSLIVSLCDYFTSDKSMIMRSCHIKVTIKQMKSTTY